MTNSSEEGNYVTPVTLANTVVLGISLGVLFLVNMTINVMLIAIIRWSEKLASKPMSLILQSFLVSDIISAINSLPVWYKTTIGFEIYGLPDFVCRITWLVNHFTSYVTSLQILLLTLYRYYGIVHWKKVSRITRGTIQKAIIIVWIVSAVVALPIYALMKSQKVDRTKKFNAACSGNPDVDRKFKETYTSVIYSLFFYLPFIAMCIITICLVYEMYSMKDIARLKRVLGEIQFNRRINENRQIVRALLAVNGMYLVGFIPYTYSIFSALVHAHDIEWTWTNYTLYVIGYACVRISEAFNPFVYILTSSDLKIAVHRMFAPRRRTNRNFSIQTISSTV